MGLFKDFKDDFAQAVNELVPGGEMEPEQEKSQDLVVDTLNEEVDVESELSKLDGLLEQVDDKEHLESSMDALSQRAEVHQRTVAATAMEEEPKPAYAAQTMDTKPVMPEMKKETKTMSDMPINMEMRAPQNNVNPSAVTEEVSLITASTVLSGDLQSSGSFDIQGTINGNITCNGKITVTGTINGNSNASEFFADVAKIEGEVVSTGTVKIGAGSVIIGYITAASAVIAGAVKGDIDVQGPVVVVTSAVIMGNIKSRSVQINNGAVIEGFCSQCYADIDVQGLFEGK